ncbi:hypothetical protein [Phyllobacterium zundukense]|uniref:Uncharacterized protein n=1 Tax=Phyllobacterium zundukense TaxID=1867719 RepID=A0A2N9VS41_9HYPH|nr:hypothetical protein [Phyllobacterium zundukense]ATU92731.1 hypothetical protein BLM14_14660 [Phyllobacterium zundukense]PIO42309.1 hypothetical protein B5P45_25120 [Phyllobacterium zundukense]
MAKYFIIGETGKDKLWLVDVKKGSVTELPEADLKTANDSDLIQIVENARKHGITTIKGINLAIATNTRPEPGSRSSITDPDD